MKKWKWRESHFGRFMRNLLISLTFICMFSTIYAEKNNPEPHLTPAKLIGSRFSKDTFGSIKIALVGYCPPPSILSKYNPIATTEQYFIHVSPSSVQICRHGEMQFLSVFHVYGGPVSSALLEELSYYGIKYVLAYGLAGSLGTKNLKMGDVYLVEKALAKDGTTIHYTDEQLIESDQELNKTILNLAKTDPDLAKMVSVQALTDDAIYREYEEQLKEAACNNCDVVNCDSSHLFAVSKKVGISSTECGIISDVTGNGQSEWESTLSVMLSDADIPTNNPLERVGKIIELYVEKLMPEILKNE